MMPRRNATTATDDVRRMVGPLMPLSVTSHHTFRSLSSRALKIRADVSPRARGYGSLLTGQRGNPLLTGRGGNVVASIDYQQGFEEAWTRIATFVPKFIGFLIILFVGW